MRLLLIGFGTVGRGFAACLRDASAELSARGLRSRIVGVLDPVAGSIAAPDGLAPDRLLSAVEGGGRLEPGAGEHGLADALAAIREIEAEVVVEMTPTDLVDGGAGLLHVREALANGRHVATTNKGPVALAYDELDVLARASGVQLRCEGTVLSGTPVIGLYENGLRGAGLTGVRGVLNGTCNYILGRMEQGDEYEDALASAQALGYAETDPSGDVEGTDAAAKVTILANLLLGAGVALEDVTRTGIGDLDGATVRDALGRGRRWKLVGEVARDRSGWRLVVEPRELPAADPLARVEGPANVVVFDTRSLGEVAIYGPGAGSVATGHALIADLLAIHRGASSP